MAVGVRHDIMGESGTGLVCIISYIKSCCKGLRNSSDSDCSGHTGEKHGGVGDGLRPGYLGQPC